MKTKTRHNLPLFAVIVLCIALLAFGAYKLMASQNDAGQSGQPADTSAEYSGPTDAEKQQVEDNKTEAVAPVPPEENKPVNGDKSVKISRAEFDNANKRLVVQTQLFGTGWRQCTLELTKGSEKVTKTADSIYQPEFSSCLGFSINASEFPSAGEWSLRLSVANSDNKTYTSSPQNINITK